MSCYWRKFDGNLELVEMTSKLEDIEKVVELMRGQVFFLGSKLI